MTEQSSFAGQIMVITGGANGIGLATAQACLARGASVVMIDHDDAALATARRDLASFGAMVSTYKADVGNLEDLHSAASAVERDVGFVDGLVTCAGITRPGSAIDMSAEDWSIVLRVNLDGTFFACQAFAKAMRARGKGAIVTVSSVLGLSAQSQSSNYIASKWGVTGITKALAIEWGRNGIRVNGVAPGPIDTALYRKLPEQFRQQAIISRSPLGRVSDPSEVAEAICFLLSDAAASISGAILPVDGGLTTGHSNMF